MGAGKHGTAAALVNVAKGESRGRRQTEEDADQCCGFNSSLHVGGLLTRSSSVGQEIEGEDT